MCTNQSIHLLPLLEHQILCRPTFHRALYARTSRTRLCTRASPRRHRPEGRERRRCRPPPPRLTQTRRGHLEQQFLVPPRLNGVILLVFGFSLRTRIAPSQQTARPIPTAVPRPHDLLAPAGLRSSVIISTFRVLAAGRAALRRCCSRRAVCAASVRGRAGKLWSRITAAWRKKENHRGKLFSGFFRKK
jgi:hypothetical protein